MDWLTEPVQGTLLGNWLYFPCTPSSQGVEAKTSAANPLGLSQSPFPLFLPLVLFGLFPQFGLPWKPAAGLDTG